MAARQARREVAEEISHVVAEREERRDRWKRMEGEIILEARRRRVRRSTREKQAQQREAERRRREALAAEEQRRLAAEDLRRQEEQKIDGAVQEKVSRAWGSKAINAHRRAMKKDRRAKAVEKEKSAVNLGGGASWSVLPTGAVVISRD